LTLSKTGYAPTRVPVVSDREVTAMVTLRATPRAAAARPARARPAPGAKPSSDGKVREGLSVDPFAEDGTKEPE
jgi:hypothetical protein